MAEIPKTVTLELEENDVQEDIVKVLESMSKIRSAALVDNKLDEKQKDEYLHLAYRLASGIEALADNSLLGKMDSLVKIVDKDKRLLRYDYLQDNYWRKNNPEFTSTLDRILISIFADDLSSLSNKHHILQAIKFLGVKESPFEEKEKVYETISPVNGRVKEQKKKSLKEKLFGYSYRIEQEDEFVLKVKGNTQFLDDLVEQATDLGYNELQIGISSEKLGKLKERFPTIKLVNEINPRNENRRLEKFVKNAIKYTAPISYPLLGCLSGKLQGKINQYTNKYSTEDVLFFSVCTEIFGGLAGSITGAFMKNPLFIFPGIYCFVEGLARLMIATSPGGGDTVPTLPGKILSYPLEKLTKPADNDTQIRIKLPNSISKKEDINQQNMFTYFTKAAQLEIPKEIQGNLSWSTENHHHYAREFASYFDTQLKELGAKPLLESYIDKKNQIYNVFSNVNLGHYRRLTTLAFSKDNRYILSFTVKPQDSQDYIKTVNETLAKNINDIEKAKEITQKLDALHVHLARFKDKNELFNEEIVN